MHHLTYYLPITYYLPRQLETTRESVPRRAVFDAVGSLSIPRIPTIMTVATLEPGQAELPSPDSTASYWHVEPSDRLLGHRTTPDLPAEADIVVVGSGITGAFAARELVNAGRSVLLLEAREACWGATGRVSLS
jgi:hypothetical protein